MSRGFPLPRAVSELRSPGAACSTISPPVPYTVSPVSIRISERSVRIIVRISRRMSTRSRAKNSPIAVLVRRMPIETTRYALGLNIPGLDSFRNSEAGRDSRPSSIFVILYTLIYSNFVDLN